MLRQALLLSLALGATSLPALADDNQKPRGFGPLMSDEERSEHMEKMRSLAPEERFEYMQKHRAEMQKRAEQRMAEAAESGGMPAPGSCGAGPQQQPRRMAPPQWQQPPVQGYNPYYGMQHPMMRHYAPGYMMGPYGPGYMPQQMMGPYGYRGPVGPYGPYGPYAAPQAPAAR